MQISETAIQTNFWATQTYLLTSLFTETHILNYSNTDQGLVILHLFLPVNVTSSINCCCGVCDKLDSLFWYLDWYKIFSTDSDRPEMFQHVQCRFKNNILKQSTINNKWYPLTDIQKLMGFIWRASPTFKINHEKWEIISGKTMIKDRRLNQRIVMCLSELINFYARIPRQSI